MSAFRANRADVCSFEDCGSRHFVIGNDGFTYCSRGHQQSDRGALVAEDTGDLVIKGRTARRLEGDTGSVSSKASGFQGARALEQYLLCLQLVLRKQTKWLIQAQNLPLQIEAVIRDIWSLRLRQISTRVSSDGRDHSDPERYHSSSQSADETTDSRSTNRSTRSHRPNRVPGLLDLLAICYLGTLLMRQPITIADIHQWADQGCLTYYQTNNAIPLAMRTRLPAKYQDMLLAQTLGTAQRLHDRVISMSTSLGRDFGWNSVGINERLILYRWLRELTLPIEMFSGVLNLARVLGCDFKLHDEKDAAASTRVLRSPLIRLMALLIINVKLHSGSLTDKVLSPQLLAESSSVRVDATSGFHAPKAPFKRDTELAEFPSLMEDGAMELQNTQLDGYLDWYESTLASSDTRELDPATGDIDLRRTLSRLFTKPMIATTDQSSSAARAPKLSTLINGATRAAQHSALLMSMFQLGNDSKKMGADYPRFVRQEELPESSKSFHQQAAALAGANLRLLIRAVYTLETELLHFEKTLRQNASTFEDPAG